MKQYLFHLCAFSFCNFVLFLMYMPGRKCQVKPPCSINTGKRCTRLSKSDIRVQIVHSDHNATRSNDDEEDVKEPMVNIRADDF